MPREEKGKNRCLTGIDGLDNLLNGGIPRGSTVLLSGSCGTGKTSMGMEFLLHGALHDEGGLFISTTETSEDLLSNMIPYEFFSEELLKRGKLVFIDMNSLYERLGLDKAELDFEDIDFLTSAIYELVSELQTKRVVIDSITSICYRFKTKEKIREFLIGLSRLLYSRGCTTLLMSETEPGDQSHSSFGVEDDISDGVILMGNLERRGDMLRTLQVVKMRGTLHSRAKYVVDLTPCGTLLVPLLKGGGA